MEFDYIVVGGGSAGSVLTNRLSEDGRYSVLLLEAGPSDNRLYVQVPLGYGKVFYDKRINWKYETEPDPSLNNRRAYWPRGKVLGGSSSINAMVYVRGHPNDYKEWNSAANGWGWDAVAPVFKKMEHWSRGADEYRGGDGPLHVYDTSKDVHPLCEVYRQAAEESQIPWNNDYNSASMSGAALYQITTHKGLRASAAACYLRPAKSRKNVNIETAAHATRIVFNAEKKAIAVEYRKGGHANVAKARREVIVAAGALNSPQLLQLSGVGPAALLKEHNIPLVHDSSQVGENLQDHLGADVVCRTNVPTLNQELGTWAGRFKAVMQYLISRRGPISLSLNQAGGFVKSTPDVPHPDLQLYFSPVSYTRAPVGQRPLIRPDPFPGILIGYNPCKPTSVGSVHIKSRSAFDAPQMTPNYLTTEHDQKLMLAGMRLMRSMLSTDAFGSVVEEELSPGSMVSSDEDMMRFIRDNAWTVFHQCSTCRMGDHPETSVVSASLKVHGVDGLRVVDASVFPSIPTGNTNAPVIMVAEKAAQHILEEAI